MFLSPSPFVSLKINKEILKKTKPLLIVRLGFQRVGVSTALLPMRLNICDWPFAVVCVRDSTSSSLIFSLFSKNNYIKNINNPLLY